MISKLERYAGRTVEIIYIDRKRNITQRVVAIRGVRGDAVSVYCFRRRGFRLLKRENILAVSVVKGRRTG